MQSLARAIVSQQLSGKAADTIWGRFLMFSLARPDVLPVGDLGVRKGMQLHFKLRTLPEASKMIKLAAPWQRYRSIASWYMWRSLES